MKFDELDDEIIKEGISRMQKQFDERAVTEIGEFLHIAALRLMMVEQGVIAHSMEEETSLCTAYIDDLLATKRMPQNLWNTHLRGYLRLMVVMVIGFQRLRDHISGPFVSTWTKRGNKR